MESAWKLVAEIGVTGTLGALVTFLLWRYVPRVIDAHLEFIKTSSDQGERIIAVQESLADRLTSNATFEKKTNMAMRQACEVIECFARGTPHEAEIKAHVRDIRATLTQD